MLCVLENQFNSLIYVSVLANVDQAVLHYPTYLSIDLYSSNNKKLAWPDWIGWIYSHTYIASSSSNNQHLGHLKSLREKECGTDRLLLV